MAAKTQSQYGVCLCDASDAIDQIARRYTLCVVNSPFDAPSATGRTADQP
jgi:hypothetical protein